MPKRARNRPIPPCRLKDQQQLVVVHLRQARKEERNLSPHLDLQVGPAKERRREPVELVLVDLERLALAELVEQVVERLELREQPEQEVVKARLGQEYRRVQALPDNLSQEAQPVERHQVQVALVPKAPVPNLVVLKRPQEDKPLEVSLVDNPDLVKRVQDNNNPAGNQALVKGLVDNNHNLAPLEPRVLAVLLLRNQEEESNLVQELELEVNNNLAALVVAKAELVDKGQLEGKGLLEAKALLALEQLEVKKREQAVRKRVRIQKVQPEGPSSASSSGPAPQCPARKDHHLCAGYVDDYLSVVYSRFPKTDVITHKVSGLEGAFAHIHSAPVFRPAVSWLPRKTTSSCASAATTCPTSVVSTSINTSVVYWPMALVLVRREEPRRARTRSLVALVRSERRLPLALRSEPPESLDAVDQRAARLPPPKARKRHQQPLVTPLKVAKHRLRPRVQPLVVAPVRIRKELRIRTEAPRVNPEPPEPELLLALEPLRIHQQEAPEVPRGRLLTRRMPRAEAAVLHRTPLDAHFRTMPLNRTPLANQEGNLRR